MAIFWVRYELNKDINFMLVMNFLVSYKVISLESAALLHKRFKLGEDVEIEISEELTPAFARELDSLGCTYE